MRAKHNTAKQLKVMVVDDSAVVRKIFAELISSTADMLLISTASDPIFAMRHMEKELPDVIVLDIEMPRMDGVTFLKKLMCEQPIPVVICSTLTEDGNDMAFQAMSAGAVGLIPKPKIGIKDYLHGERDLILNTLRSAAISNLSNINKPVRAKQKINSVDKTLTKSARISPKAVSTSEKYSADVILNSSSQSINQTTEQVIAIGTSTGGTQALEKVLTALPRVTPGIVVVQHMPEKFTKAFAKRLNSFCAMDVKEAEDGDRVVEGQALIAPGAKHMLLKRSGAKYYVEVKDGPLVNRHKPSVDVLFRSVANIAGKNAIGIIMTGMGDDGARGLCEMHHTGATTYAQDEDSCVVFGMPKEAIRLGGVDIILPLDEIATTIQHVISSGGS